jgi:hypothetical protein
MDIPITTLAGLSSLTDCKYPPILISSVADPDSHPDPDPLVKDMDTDPDPSVIKQK